VDLPDHSERATGEEPEKERKNMAKPLFVVEIVNTNSSTATARRGHVEVSAHPSYETNTGLVLYSDKARQVREIMAQAPAPTPTGDAVEKWLAAERDAYERVYGQHGDTDERVALFDKKTAHAVGLACRWNNQQYRVKPARGRNRRDGIEVPAGEGRWKSCQED
jgi:hypothetical protein